MNKKKLISFGTTLFLAAALVLGMQIQTDAEETQTHTYKLEQSEWSDSRMRLMEHTTYTETYYDELYDAETDSYVKTPYTYEYTEDSVALEYEKKHEFTVGMADVNYSNYSFYGGGGGYSQIDIYREGFTVQNVRSSNKNIKVALTATRRYKSSYADYISDYYISYFAKKAGKAAVSFDVYKDGKFVQTCSISVIAKGYKFYKPVIKNVKYAGKELYYYDPFTNKTSGKLKVTPAKGYKIVSIEYTTGIDAKTGDYTYKKIKNNGKIKLIKQRKYTRKYSEGTEYESQYAYNSLFPVTQIRITLQNKKTKETVEDYEYLYTLNRK
ncbi:hypothetical protein KQI22_09400 [Kineothrix sp. MSJ-39]|uniref:hypothetical protein n=1 Tax=Kineothrix sp. MSJ-39 TaxID=2841533 RepID=UPI001C104549|nr:hypothetical protein [Kineothrix sp. MSJ-39]MBU5430272.1 hypothetical protein [Kineothrix sp. MSJ-39]